jgi:hypothetical protein
MTQMAVANPIIYLLRNRVYDLYAVAKKVNFLKQPILILLLPLSVHFIAFLERVKSK